MRMFVHPEGRHQHLQFPEDVLWWNLPLVTQGHQCWQLGEVSVCIKEICTWLAVSRFIFIWLCNIINADSPYLWPVSPFNTYWSFQHPLSIFCAIWQAIQPGFSIVPIKGCHRFWCAIATALCFIQPQLLIIAFFIKQLLSLCLSDVVFGVAGSILMWTQALVIGVWLLVIFLNWLIVMCNVTSSFK